MKYVVMVKIKLASESKPYWSGWVEEEDILPEVAALKARKMYGEMLEKLLDIKIKKVPDYLDVSICDACRIQENAEDREKTVYTPMYTNSDSRSDTFIWRIWRVIALVSLSGLLISQILQLLSELL